MDDMVLSLGFWRTPLKHAIYVRWNGDAQLVVGVYVDDLVITGRAMTMSSHSRRRWGDESAWRWHKRFEHVNMVAL
jgi:hypothetical protein